MTPRLPYTAAELSLGFWVGYVDGRSGLLPAARNGLRPGRLGSAYRDGYGTGRRVYEVLRGPLTRPRRPCQALIVPNVL
jgi:hypothetical protein